MFYNFSTKPFTYTWGRIPYTFLPGTEYSGAVIADDGAHSVELNEIVSNFFAKHLAEWVLNTPEMNQNWDKDGKTTQGYPMKYNTTSIEMLVKRATSPAGVEVDMPSFANELPILERHLRKEEPVVAPVPEVVSEALEEPQAKKRAPGKPKKEDFNLE
jgi:hypothetical protein